MFIFRPIPCPCRLSWSKTCKKKVVEIVTLIILLDIFNLPFFTISMTILTYCSCALRLCHCKEKNDVVDAAYNIVEEGMEEKNKTN